MRAAVLMLPLMLACGPKKADFDVEPASLAGVWSLDGGSQATIEVVDGVPVFTALVDSDGEVFVVQESIFKGGHFEWTYLVPSTGYVVREVVTSADEHTLCTQWSNQNDQGTDCYTR